MKIPRGFLLLAPWCSAIAFLAISAQAQPGKYPPAAKDTRRYHAIDPAAHQWIAYQAYRFYSGQIDGADLQDYIGAHDDYPSYVFHTLCAGAAAEDLPGKAPLFQGQEGNSDHPSLRHFCGGSGAMFTGLSFLDVPGFPNFTKYNSALQQAEGGGIEDQYKEGLWPYAVNAYLGANQAPLNKSYAFFCLGHVAHLLTDMCTPAHTHNDMHPDFYDPSGHLVPDPFESWAADRGDTLNTYNFMRYQWPDRVIQNLDGGGIRTIDVWQRTIVLRNNLLSIFMLAANYTDDYPSNNAPGDTSVAYGTPDIPELHVPGSVAMGTKDAAQLKLIGDDLIPYAIWRTAELYRLFYKTVDATPPRCNIVYPISDNPNSPTLRPSASPLRVVAEFADPESGIVLNTKKFFLRERTGTGWSTPVPIPAASGADFAVAGNLRVGVTYGVTTTAENGAGLTYRTAERYFRLTSPALKLAYYVTNPSSDSVFSNNYQTGTQILEVDPDSGNRHLVSGCLMYDPTLVTIDPASGDIYAYNQMKYSFTNTAGKYDGDWAIWRINRAGKATLIGGLGAGSGPVLTSATDMAWSPEGLLYVADAYTDAIFSVNPVNGARSLVSKQTSRGGGAPLGEPVAIAVDPAGALYVSDNINDTLLRIHPSSGDRSIVASDSVGGGPEIVDPGALAIDPAGNPVVIDAYSNRVVRVNKNNGDRTLISENLSPYTGPQFMNPTALAYDASGLLVLDNGQKSLLRVHGDGRRELVSGKLPADANQARGTGPFWFSNPQALAVEPGGAIIVCDSVINALFRIDPASGDRQILEGSIRGTGPFAYNPKSIIKESDGTLILLDADWYEPTRLLRIDLATGNRTLLYENPDFESHARGLIDAALTDTGRLIFSSYGSYQCILRANTLTGRSNLVSSNYLYDDVGGGDDMNHPAGLIGLDDGSIAVVDNYDNRLLIVNPLTGMRKALVPSGITMSDPLDIAIDGTGKTFYVSDRAGGGHEAIYAIDRTTGAGRIVSGYAVGANVGAGLPFEEPAGIDLDSSGRLIVVDHDACSLLKVEPVTGNRTVISQSDMVADRYKGSGPYFYYPQHVAIAPATLTRSPAAASFVDGSGWRSYP